LEKCKKRQQLKDVWQDCGWAEFKDGFVFEKFLFNRKIPHL